MVHPTPKRLGNARGRMRRSNLPRMKDPLLAGHSQVIFKFDGNEYAIN
jgi:hypothetical protein